MQFATDRHDAFLYVYHRLHLSPNNCSAASLSSFLDIGLSIRITSMGKPCHIFRTKHFPGKARTSSRISKVKSVPVNWETESLLVSTSASICAGLSGESNLKTVRSFSE